MKSAFAWLDTPCFNPCNMFKNSPPNNSILSMLLMLGLACIPAPSVLANERCSAEMNNHAQSTLSAAQRTWPALARHQQAFASCDDGSLGEGYSEAVVHLLAHHWGKFTAFATIARRDPDFQDWALRHIDATAKESDLKRIIASASSCNNNKSVDSQCELVRQAAEKALVEAAKTAS